MSNELLLWASNF